MQLVRLVNKQGFTLIELLIVVAIVGILAAIGYPSYVEHVRKARRADAQGALLQNVQFMERIYTQTGCFNPGGSDKNDCGTASTPTLPVASSDYYTYSFKSGEPTTNSFVIEAAPKGGQTADMCGTLTINHVGVKKPDSGSKATCWRK